MSNLSWFLESPEDGGRVLANDERHTVIHIPPCSPFNADAIRDARLIAAAPELLAACKDFVDYERAMEDGNHIHAMLIYADMQHKAALAIAKAEGKP